MKVWLFQTSEPLPIKGDNMRLLRTGMMAEALTNRGHEVVWFTGTFNHFKHEHYYNHDETIKINDKYTINLIHAVGYKKNISIKRIINHKVIAIKLRKKIQKLPKPDLIYASYPAIEFAYEAIKYGKKENIPVIVDIRDLWPDIFSHNLPKILKIPAIPFIKYLDKKCKYICKNAYCLNSISNKMLDWGLKKAGRKKKKNDRYFYIGYKKSVMSLNIKSELVDKTKFNICFFATINNQFNYEAIIELANNLKNEDINILICGVGPKLDYFKSLAKNSNNIKFLGFLDKEKLHYVLTNSDMGLVPYNNTFDFRMSVSNKYAEYLSYGLPILLTIPGLMKELTDKYKVGYASLDVKKISSFVCELKKNSEKYKIYSNNSSNLFTKMFDASKIYIDVVKYIENIEKEY